MLDLPWPPTIFGRGTIINRSTLSAALSADETEKGGKDGGLDFGTSTPQSVHTQQEDRAGGLRGEGCASEVYTTSRLHGEAEHEDDEDEDEDGARSSNTSDCSYFYSQSPSSPTHSLSTFNSPMPVVVTPIDENAGEENP